MPRRKSEDEISAKFAESNKVELAEKAERLERWAEAIDSPDFKHAHGKFTAGDTPRDSSGRFTKGSGGGGIQKHRCVWGALADLRVQDGVGSWSYGGYTDEGAVGTNMPSQQLAAFVGLTDGDVVADITRNYLAQHIPGMANTHRGIPEAMVSYNDSHGSYGKLSQVMRDTAADIRRRLETEQATTA